MTNCSVEKYLYDADAANRPIRFIETFCTHTKGPKAGKPLVLEEWQRSILREAFGWKRTDNGLRRYRVVYLEVPRKNGKSTLASGVALYLLLGDKESGAKVFSAAGTRSQASLVFDDAMQMVAQNPRLRERLRIQDSWKTMTTKGADIPSQRGVLEYKAISADAFNAHGLNPSGIIFDEVHTQKTRDLWDALQTGTGAREQPMTFATTTAGNSRTSLCWELHQHALRVKTGVVADDSFLPVIYAADMDDDWGAESTWRKANPNYGISIREEFLADEHRRATTLASYENSFRTLYLNQWVGQAERYIQMDHWDKCLSPVTDEELRWTPCFAGIDLASTCDITSIGLVFPREENYAVRTYSFIPEETANHRSRQGHDNIKWMGGDVTVTPGNTCDYAAVRAKMNELRERFDIVEVGVDTWNSSQLTQDLMNDGFNVRRYPQTISTLSEPTKLFKTLVLSHRLEHNGDPLLRWMVSNLAHYQDANENVRPDKAKSGDKIDAVAATIMALGLTLQDNSPPSIQIW